MAYYYDPDTIKILKENNKLLKSKNKLVRI